MRPFLLFDPSFPKRSEIRHGQCLPAVGGRGDEGGDEVGLGRDAVALGAVETGEGDVVFDGAVDGEVVEVQEIPSFEVFLAWRVQAKGGEAGEEGPGQIVETVVEVR